MAEQVTNAEFAAVDRAVDPAHFVRHLDSISAMEQVHASKRRGHRGA